MEVVRFSNLDELQSHQVVWDQMTGGVPFRSWAWLATWWHHYAAMGQLYVLGVFDHGQLVGIAPWYRTTTLQHGRTLRCLGDGEVCSEYATILCESGVEQAVADALACWLLQVTGSDHWDVIELAPTDPGDLVSSLLAEQMADRGCYLHSTAGHGCWRVVLPSTWDEYLGRLSKERRKKIRRMQRQYVDSGKAVWHTVTTPEQLAVAQRILIDLHQQRRNSLGQPGCFVSPRYHAFHDEVMARLLQQAQLALHWVEFEGRPIAAEYQLLGSDTVYCYQGGIAPKDAHLSPGQIATLFTFKEAIEQGYRILDFLRGNEPYKRQWRAHFRPNVELRIIAGRTSAQLRHGIWLASRDVKHWVKEAIGSIHGQ